MQDLGDQRLTSPAYGICVSRICRMPLIYGVDGWSGMWSGVRTSQGCDGRPELGEPAHQGHTRGHFRFPDARQDTGT